MSKEKMILLRVQSADGTKRIELLPKATIIELYNEIEKAFKLEPNTTFSIYKERNYSTEIPLATTKKTADKLGSFNLKHGDMIFMKLKSDQKTNREASNDNNPVAVNPTSSSSLLSVSSSTSIASTSSVSTASSSAAAVAAKGQRDRTTSATSGNGNNAKNKEDNVDIILSKMDGQIQRTIDSKLCRHNSNGRCVHCSPIEPWDEEYLKGQKIKHMSFHAYIRKLTSGVDRGKFAALEDLNCRIKSGCTDHPPWPKGICSKCQPSALTLNRQIYRHVDNVMFENTALVERFLNYWRTTGYQRMGFLYGTYEVHADVPLGIRARVAAIYEPPQESSQNSIKLLPDESAADVDEMAAAMGLQKVGWIFTDLVTDNANLGTVKQIRGIETHFLTAHECIMAGHLQNQHPNVTKYAPSGTFGSKFVTVCVTGDKTKQIHMEGYAVSAQCMALVRESCLIPTHDAPELGYVRESSDKQYVPDVYYKERDQYNNEVSRLARPLPVEYLLVDVPASTPLTPIYTFTASPEHPLKKPFPIENRYIDGQLQDFNAVCTYLAQWSGDEFLEAVSDFHFLLYLNRMDMLPMKRELVSLIDAIRTKDRIKAMQWKEQEVWTTLETLITASTASGNHYDSSAHNSNGFGGGGGGGGGSGADGGGGAGTSSGGGNSSSGENWECKHCTFINASRLDNCEMCSLPHE